MSKKFGLRKIPVQVKLIQRVGGRGVYSVDGLTTDKVYEVYGMDTVTYSDGTGETCYLIKTDKGILAKKSIGMFEIIDEKEAEK